MAKEKTRQVLVLFTGILVLAFGFGGAFLGLSIAEFLTGNTPNSSLMDLIGTWILFFTGLFLGVILFVRLGDELEDYVKQLIKNEFKKKKSSLLKQTDKKGDKCE